MNQLRLEEREIGRVPPRGPVGNVALRHRRRKAIGMRDGPVGEHTATAAAGHAEFLLVDVAALEKFVDADHQIAIVVARIVILNDVAELLAIAGRAARVDVEHDVAFGGHPLKFMIEDPAVGRVRAAVNVEDERILLLRIEVGRLLDPTLNALAIETGVIDFLRRSQIELRPEFPVKVGDARLAFRRRQRRRDRRSSPARRRGRQSCWRPVLTEKSSTA